jgi:hypothetical protein
MTRASLLEELDPRFAQHPLVLLRRSRIENLTPPPAAAALNDRPTAVVPVPEPFGAETGAIPGATSQPNITPARGRRRRG